jgi:hypothetical protein
MQSIANAFLDGLSIDIAKEVLKSCYTWDGVRDPQLVHDFFEEATNKDIAIEIDDKKIILNLIILKN